MSTGSTLTSSPSASPRSSFHHSDPRCAYAPAQRTPAISRASPRAPYPSSSPRRPFNAPANNPSAPQHPQKHFVQGGSIVGSGAGYVDAGTQYSPDGLPPTAKVAAAAVGHPLGGRATATNSSSHLNSTAASASKKRKEPVPPADSSPEPMSGNSASSGALHRSQPDEPLVRNAPAQSSGSRSTSSTAHSEPQEARSTHGHSAAPKRSRAESGSAKTMPLKYETCDPKDLGVLIANMLMELIRINDKIPLRDGRLTRFHSRAPPAISVSDYLQRLIQHATLSPPIMLSMVYYIDRLCTEYPAFTINSLTVHRFLITSATVAAKGLSDSFWTNPTYARIGGIPVSELATLELELLQRVNWKIVPKPEVLEEYYSSLVDRADGYEMESPSTSSDSGSLVDSEEASSGSKASSVKKDDDEMITDT